MADGRQVAGPRLAAVAGGHELANRRCGHVASVSTAIFSPDPTLTAQLYSSEGAFNFGSFDDPEARIAAFAEADARLAATLPGLPMVQLPTLVVTDTGLRNVTVNAHRAGPRLYARNWAFAT